MKYNKSLQLKHVPTEAILNYLADRQGTWTSLWMGAFPKGEYTSPLNGQKQIVSDVYWSMPEGTPETLARKKMALLYKKGLVGGCPCGCRGDFEITDKGLALIGRERATRYTGY